MGLRNRPCIVAPATAQRHADEGSHQDPRQPDLLDNEVLGAADLGGFPGR